MTDLKRLRAFRTRWGIQWDNSIELDRFKNRLIATISAAFSGDILRGINREFSFWIGRPPRDDNLTVIVDSFSTTDEFARTQIYHSIAEATNLTEIAEVIQMLLFAVEVTLPGVLEQLVPAIRTAIEYSPTIDLRLARRGDKATIYRAGARALDEHLVDDVLGWLQGYPKVAKHFEEALRVYLAKDKSKYRNLLDNLRFALEQLLRSVLQNSKSLENQAEPLLRWLKGEGVHQQIINMYQTLLKQFTQYQNDAVKHEEAFSSSEIEFMIYLTGAFLRLILELERA